MKAIRKLIFYIFLGLVLWIYIAAKQGSDGEPATQPQSSNEPQLEITVPAPAARENVELVDGSVDFIFVNKSQRIMELYTNGRAVKRYSIALGFAPDGQKYRQGDGKTPTGEYIIDYRNPQSSFYRSLHISYPRKDQVQQAKLENRNPGGNIMIHGQINGREWQGDKKIREDWTNGCISVSNNEMDEIWRLVRDGATIKIVE